MDGFTNPNPEAKRATEPQQKQFDLLLGRSREMMEKNGEQWLKAIQADPVEAAVTLGVQTVRGMASMSESAGQKVDVSVLINVGVQFIKDIAAVANAAKAVPDEQLPTYIKQVTSEFLSEYLRLDGKDGLLSPKEVQDADGMLAKMQQGSQEGAAV